MTRSAPPTQAGWRIGAYDAASWAGLVLSDRPGRGFGLKLAIERAGARADSAELFYLVHEVGPNAADGTYARVAFDTELPFGRGDETPILPRRQRQAGLVVEWARRGESGAVLRLRCEFDGVVELRGYFPWDWAGSWQAAARELRAVTTDGELQLVARASREGETALEAGEALLRWSVRRGTDLLLVAAAGHLPAVAGSTVPMEPDEGALAAELEAARRAYEDRRVAVDGAWDGLAAAVTNNVHWMVLLQPESGRRYVPAGRRWIFPRPEGGRDHWTIFEWDGLFNALELGLESPELARSALEAVLATQYPNGNVPNWRSRFAGSPDRSQPPLGAFVVLKLYLRTLDRELLVRSLPALERWSAFWRAEVGGRPRRDGNASGLFEWGSDSDLLPDWVPEWERNASGRQRAAWESGQDDLPAWDEAHYRSETGTLDLESVDLNALLVLDDECLGQIAEALGDRAKADFYRRRAGGLRAVIDARLWDEERGLYVDRHWDGRFSRRLPASGFYALLAGIPDASRAERVARILADPSRFWGAHVLPSISRDDPAFADQQYWRGTIWPPTNYLVCQGLRRYGYDALAGELAARSVALFLGSFRELQLCRENYDSRTGEGGGQRHQSWGPLFALLGIEAFADVTPWEGLRLGSLVPPGTTTLRRLWLAGHEWTVTLAPSGLRVEVDRQLLLASDRPVVLRHVQLGEEEVSAELASEADVRIASPAEERALPAGRHGLKLRRR